MVKYMKRIFTSNWYIYRVCLPSISKESRTQHHITTSEVSSITRQKSLQADKQGRSEEELSFCLAQPEINAKMSAPKESTPRDRSFEKLLLEAVDEGLSSLGDSSKQAIYFHLEKAFKISKKDIPDKIDEFANAIENIFGFGAKFLEIHIMKSLYEKAGHAFIFLPEQEKLLFAEYVTAARANLGQKMKHAKTEKGLHT